MIQSAISSNTKKNKQYKNTIPCTARGLALACLMQTRSALPFPVILEQAYHKLPASAHIQQEKNFLMALCYGVLRHHGLTKQLFLPLCRQKPTAEMEYCLSLCLYEVLFLHKEPHTAVNEYVTILKKIQGQSRANALNAILRNLLDNGHNQKKAITQLDACMQTILTQIPANQIPPRKKLRNLHSFAGLPEIFTNETDKTFVQSLTEESFYTPLPSFRINKAQINHSNIQAEHINVSHNTALKITDLLFADEYSEQYDTAEKKGILSRQGVCSALLTEKIAQIITAHSYTTAKHNDIQADSSTMLSVLSAERSATSMQTIHTAPAVHTSPAILWDMCCGRGGKTLGLLEKDIPVSLVTEPNQTRLTEFYKQLIRLHLLADANNCPPNATSAQFAGTADNTKKNIAPINKTIIIQNSGCNHSLEIRTGLAEHAIQQTAQQNFPYILLDSPCSTSGTIARNPEVRYRITQESLSEILSVQKELLRLAYCHLQHEGILFYCTCSVFTKENKEQIKQFLADFPDMHLISEEYLHAAAYSPKLKGHDILYFAVLKKN